MSILIKIFIRLGVVILSAVIGGLYAVVAFRAMILIDKLWTMTMTAWKNNRKRIVFKRPS